LQASSLADISGNEILGKALKNEGTKDVFFIMGGPMQYAETACAHEGLRMIDVRHEKAAALATQAFIGACSLLSRCYYLTSLQMCI